MPEINDYDVFADGNSLAPPNGFPEDMDYSDVNNSARELMSVVARNYRDENGSLNASGINDLTVSTNGVYAAYFQGLHIGFRAANNNTGPMTLALNGLAAAPLLNTAGAPMQENSIIAGLLHFVVYNGSTFQLITNGFTFPGGNPGLFSAASPNITPEGDDRVALLDFSNASAPSFASITAIRNATELFNASNPVATPAVGDFLHFRDVSDLNGPRTATIQEILDLNNTVFRTTDPVETPALADTFHFVDDTDGAAKSNTLAAMQTLLTAGFLQNVNLEFFQTSGTYTPPAGLIAALVICVGGGGGGGSAGTTAAAPAKSIGSGGGGGGVAISVLSAGAIGASQAYTVGAGGAGGVTGPSGNSGSAGGATTFGALSGSGGIGGNVANLSSAAVTIFGERAGGGATGGQIALSGGAGGGAKTDGSSGTSGYGGAALFGGQRAGTFQSTGGSSGLSGAPVGGGGSGAVNLGGQSSRVGGNGAAGAVIILEFLA